MYLDSYLPISLPPLGPPSTNLYAGYNHLWPFTYILYILSLYLNVILYYANLSSGQPISKLRVILCDSQIPHHFESAGTFGEA